MSSPTSQTFYPPEPGEAVYTECWHCYAMYDESLGQFCSDKCRLDHEAQTKARGYCKCSVTPNPRTAAGPWDIDGYCDD